ncbi:conserved protein of unknown function (plasmid) [Rhodovastum atsumiense]|uniref:Tyrosine-type recombinase/integrase n=1 Tax=Rhodovastum atsumiense TaxID=504468 RepID=A0A5M6IU85_9PROT|nr:hypothetical protein [Rhodovastum atsumiense]KAA5611832.1 hypothetical protein F1189_12405 [Rhodovastum atsumiense]CAH2606055.1 conserved protein of unknown function [Rhodovastum atsumiense]
MNTSTPSAATLATYAERATALVARWRREAGLPADAAPDPVKVAEWLVGLRPTMSKATWRIYRQSVRYGLLAQMDDPAVLTAETLLREPYDPRMPRPPRQDSSLRERSIPPQDAEKLTVFLMHFSRHSHAHATADWLAAGIATGLRPCEWPSAFLEGKTLHVLNAKRREGVGNGDWRTLDLSPLPEEAMGAVHRMLGNAKRWSDSGTYEDHHLACAGALREACRRIWQGRRHYTLVSARHQTATAARAGGATRTEIAALLGHAATRTTSRYGRRIRFSGGCAVPRPAVHEVASVRDNARLRHPGMSRACVAAESADAVSEFPEGAHRMI